MIDSKVILADGKQVAELMIDHGVGLRRLHSYEVKPVNTEFRGGKRALDLCSQDTVCPLAALADPPLTVAHTSLTSERSMPS